jgi:predicted small lipoprotein YifL
MMIFSIQILGRCTKLVLTHGSLAIAALLIAGCGQRGPLFLAPQSVPFTLLPAATPASSAASAAPATNASAAK